VRAWCRGDAAERQRDEERYLALLQSILKGGHLYYSTHYDLTHRAQKQHALRDDHQDKPMWERVPSLLFIYLFSYLIQVLLLFVIFKCIICILYFINFASFVQADQRFFWNRYLAQDFISSQVRAPHTAHRTRTHRTHCTAHTC
jgi:hypothetical protein